MLFNHLKYNKVVQIGTRVSIFLMVVSDVSPGTQEFWLIGSVSSSEVSRELKLKSSCFFKLFGTLMQSNANAGRSAICIHKNLLSDDASLKLCKIQGFLS